MTNFWRKLPKNFMALAPMEDVTDAAFRQMLTILPKPDIMFTEFTSADGLSSKGKDFLLQKLQFTENQRPIVAQIWGANPITLNRAAKLVRKLKFDGVDINMGCPVRKVVVKGSGAALAKNFTLTREIISAVKTGSGGMPVSVKTRLGFDSIITEQWSGFLLEQRIAALAIHGRIATQMSQGEANWKEIGKVVKLKNKIAPKTIIIGNGDVKSYKQAQEMCKKYGVDSVMIGRGIFHNPWIFEKTLTPKEHTKEEKIEMLKKHLSIYEEMWGSTKNFEIMKKFFKIYIKDFDDAGQLRQKLMECRKYEEVFKILQQPISTIIQNKVKFVQREVI